MSETEDEYMRNSISNAIHDYYGEHKTRFVRIFRVYTDEHRRTHCEFLLDRRLVVRYSVGPDDKGYGVTCGALSVGIGPHYFSPYDFWNHEDAERFRMEASPESIKFNLQLLDEFLASQR
jgi:hypothetical protein